MSSVTTYLCLAGSILNRSNRHNRAGSLRKFFEATCQLHIGLMFRSHVLATLLPASNKPTGVVYALWSGLSIVLVTAVAWVWTKQVVDLPTLFGMALITAGVVVINVFSNSTTTDEAVSQVQS
jgi:multidrug transporter EmrE-like cation transporter